MSVANEIAEYLEDQTIGTVGTNIFVGFMPHTPDTCVGVYDYAGQPPDVTGNLELPRVQIQVRAAARATAHTKIRAIYDALNELIDTTIETKSYRYIQATGAPEQAGRDGKNRSYFLVNFQIYKEEE